MKFLAVIILTATPALAERDPSPLDDCQWRSPTFTLGCNDNEHKAATRQKPDTKPDNPKPDQPKPDNPKPDAPKPDRPKPDTPKPDHPKCDKPKGNKGLGNGDEGNCRGRGCDDKDNPGHHK